MNALEVAMQMELDGEKFYLKLAEQADNEGFKAIFTQLADDEHKHHQIFANMHHLQEPFSETRILKDAANVFKQMIAKDSLENLDSSQLELYQNAMNLEKKSQQYYLEKAAEASNNQEQELFQKIAAEEKKHFFLLHNIYELVLRPQIWVENGEFVHLEDY